MIDRFDLTILRDLAILLLYFAVFDFTLLCSALLCFDKIKIRTMRLPHLDTRLSLYFQHDVKALRSSRSRPKANDGRYQGRGRGG